MDDKTAELRDIFVDATGAEEVTERQAESPGSLTDEPADIDDRVSELIETMRERYDFQTELDDEACKTIVYGFHDGDSDADLADRLDVSAESIRTARLDLHLVREDDRDAPFEIDTLRQRIVAGESIDDCAAELDASVDTVEHYSPVVEADLQSTRANDRFRDGFRELLTDADLAGMLARDAREDGLRDATEDIETDVSL